MKRMVENSEKIEELADAVEIKNGDLITSNITTPGGDKISIFNDKQPYFEGSFPGSVFLVNLGTALIFEVTINSGTTKGKYPIARMLSSDNKLTYVKISNGNEFNPSLDAGGGPDDYVVATEFDESLADHTKTEYKLILLIGHYSQEL